MLRRPAGDEDTCDMECSSVDPAMYPIVSSGAKKVAVDSFGRCESCVYRKFLFNFKSWVNLKILTVG
jgi:hypothetical protein